MTASAKVNLKFIQGSTFSEVFRYESYTKVYKPITNITKAAPMVVTAVAHGAPIGWRTKISNVVGMKEANSDDYIIVTDTTSDTLTYNEVNASGYTAYTSGGILEYNEPKSLVGMTARMQVRAKTSSTDVLLECTTENSMIKINDSSKTITLNIPAATTTALTFRSAVYSMELVSGITVIPFIYGSITLDTEITR